MSDPTPDEQGFGAYGQPQPGAAPPPGYPPPQAPGAYPGGPPAGAWSGPRPRGPIGEARSPAMTILLSIVTCGIWTILWSYWTHEELKRYRGDGIGGVAGALLAAFVSPVVMFTVPMEIEVMFREDGREPPVTTLFGLWFLLPIIGNFIWYLKVQKVLNEYWMERGAPAPG